LDRHSYDKKFSGHIIIAVWILALVLLFLVILEPVTAALITGSIYDLSLNKEKDVIVFIDTVPKQILVSKTGDYEFNADPGNYTLYAYTQTSEAKEAISINEQGEYTIDMVLEEKLSYENNTFNDLNSSDIPLYYGINTDINTKDTTIPLWVYLVILLAILVLCLLAFIFLRKHKHVVAPDLDEYDSKILGIMKKEKRITQKDLRKEIPLSEAKISLIVADLEHKGKIRKIKKGRGNILIFVKE